MTGKGGRSFGGRLNLVAGIDMPYAGSVSFIAAQLAAGMLDLFNGRDTAHPARMVFWHTTRSDKWFAAFRPFFRAAADMGLGIFSVDDGVWYESKPIAFTQFTLADGISSEAAKAMLDTLLSSPKINERENVTTLYRACRQSSTDVQLEEQECSDTGIQVRYNTATTGLFSAGAYRII
jgi:hypothetical protein